MGEQRINGRFLLLGDGPRIGGMSVVHRAIDVLSLTGESVAVKLLHKRSGPLANEFLDREQQSLRRLGEAGHPNLVRLIDAGWSEELDQAYLVLEWVDHNLKQKMDVGEAMSWRQFYTDIGAPLISALACAHMREVEHRDLKPANVLLTADGQVKLADFGIAKIRDNFSPTAETVAGYRSGLYAPPDVNCPPYVRDVFSWGVLAIQALSGSAASDYADLSAVLDGLDLQDEVRGILRACVDLDAARRPGNASVLEQQLARVEQRLDDSEARRACHLWLQLTRLAAQVVLGRPRNDPEALAREDWKRAESLLLEDLAGAVHADYGIDRDSGKIDHNAVILTCRTYQMTIVPDNRTEEYRTAIVKVQKVRPEQRARWCESRVDLGAALTFTFTNPGERAAALGWEEMAARLDRQAEDRERAEQERAAAVSADLFEGWGRLLNARDDLAAGGRAPVTYTRAVVEPDGCTWRLYLAQTPVAEKGEEWSVAEHERGRPVERGDVVAVDREDDVVRLRCSRNARVPERGVLVPYLGASRVSLKRQREALAALTTGDSLANPQLPAILLDPGRAPAGEPVTISAWLQPNLDDSKREVVRYALGTQPLLVVEGPPGTGKTTMIAEIVEQNLRRSPGLKVLIVSQTHIAVDNALRRLEEAGVTGMVRLARPDDPNVGANARHLLLDPQMKKWVQQVRRSAQQYMEDMAGRLGQEPRHLRGALHLQQLASVAADLEYVEHRLARLEEGDNDFTTSEQARGDAIVSTRQRRDDLLAQRAEVFADAQREVRGDLTLSEKQSAQDSRDAIAVLLGQSQEARALMNVIRVQGDWLLRMGNDPDIIAEYLRTRSIVGGTAIGFLGHPAARTLEFDLCIFDEASKASGTEALVSMVRAKRWILIGDPNQLPPLEEDLLRNKTVMQEHQLTPTLVTTTLFDHVLQQTTSPVHQKLLQQYRMTPAIGNLISKCFYNGDLQSPANQHLDGYATLGKPVLWIDTGPLANRREHSRATGETSVVNRAEATQVIHRLTTINKAVEKNLVLPPKDRTLEVLVITPYSRQVDELHRRLAATPLPHLQVDVLSVDAVQGRECDVAVFSVTRSNDRGEFGFIGQHYRRRINVALSRARYGLTIIGDARFCRSKPGPLRDVLHYMDGHRDDCEIRDAHR